MPNSKLPSAEQVRSDLAAARQKLADATEALRAAFVADAAGDPKAYISVKDRAVDDAKREVSRLEAVLQAAEAAEADRAVIARKLAAKRADDAVRATYAKQAVAAQDHASAIEAYVETYLALLAAQGAAMRVGIGNPRVRSDITHLPVERFTAHEISRVAAGRKLPPGAHKAVGTGVTGTLPFVEHFRRMAEVIIPPPE